MVYFANRREAELGSQTKLTFSDSIKAETIQSILDSIE